MGTAPLVKPSQRGMFEVGGTQRRMGTAPLVKSSQKGRAEIGGTQKRMETAPLVKPSQRGIMKSPEPAGMDGPGCDICDFLGISVAFFDFFS